METLSIEVSPQLKELYDDVQASRPEAALNFAQGMPAGSRFEGRHTPDQAGNSEVRLADGADAGALAHELLHALFYREGFPFATCLMLDTSFAAVAQIVICAVSHPTMHEEAQARGLPDAAWRDKIIGAAGLDEPDEPAASEASLIQAWRLADAVFLDREAVAALTERCRSELPQTWEVVEHLLQAMERCRAATGIGWRRSMVDLLTYFDTMARAHHPEVAPPLKLVSVSLVLTEPQAKRPADRMVEIELIENNAAAFVHKQDHAVFFFRYLGPQVQKREVVQLRSEVKQMRTIEFLDRYRVPYSIELRQDAAVSSP